MTIRLKLLKNFTSRNSFLNYFVCAPCSANISGSIIQFKAREHDLREHNPTPHENYFPADISLRPRRKRGRPKDTWLRMAEKKGMNLVGRVGLRYNWLKTDQNGDLLFSQIL